MAYTTYILCQFWKNFDKKECEPDQLFLLQKRQYVTKNTIKISNWGEN